MDAIKYSPGNLTIVDQLLLPQKLEYTTINSCEDAWEAIHSMKIRGAPAIAIVGGLSLAVDLYHLNFQTPEDLLSFVTEKLDYLVTSRPTAVNLSNLRKRHLSFLDQLKREVLSVDVMKKKIISELEMYRNEDISCNKSIGEHGANALLKLESSNRINILTHCNTGALATSGYGTALGVVRKLHESSLLEHCYFTETRPYNQGSRLTAYELKYEDIPSTMICDSMVAALMTQRKITAVITGADCIAANGDTANKIGTYQMAVVAKYHGVPFYVAAPTSSINLRIESGKSIVIEERPQEEMTNFCGVRTSVEGVKCWNPSFDVTPHELITGGIITERGVFDVASLKEQVSMFSFY